MIDRPALCQRNINDPPSSLQNFLLLPLIAHQHSKETTQVSLQLQNIKVSKNCFEMQSTREIDTVNRESPTSTAYPIDFRLAYANQHQHWVFRLVLKHAPLIAYGT